MNTKSWGRNFGASQTLNRHLNTERGVGRDLDPNNVDVDEACSCRGGNAGRKESGGGNRIADIRNAFFPSAGADNDDEDLAVGFTPRVCVDSQCSACRGRRERDYTGEKGAGL